MSIQQFSTSERRKRRALAVMAGVLAAETVWLVSELAFGVHPRMPAGNGHALAEIGPVTVAVASAVLSLLGWGVLALLERVTSHARGIWRVMAPLALIASLGMPLSGTGVTAANRVVLVLMHLVVAAIVVPLLYRTSPPAKQQPRQAAGVPLGEAA
ncbi:MAG TPA: DUF6069 family protein [Chloroflexota bacterium]|nr:DUF6069 family protein [Chloroflexota bacterium]